MPPKMAIKNEDALCEVEFVDKGRVDRVRSQMPDPSTIDVLSDIFKALGDPSRLRIISALMVNELCVCDIANLLGTSISAVSHQLRVLRNMKLVEYRKDGKMVYYSLKDGCIEKLLRVGLKHADQ